MNIHIVTASAGTGKTTRLAALLEEAVRSADARPEAIVATTFTKQAAAELLNRARTRLLRNGSAREARALLAARIGTVNSVCGALVSDFSFELGLSPDLSVLDETGAEVALKRALASTVTDELSNDLQSYRGKFDASFDWHYEVQRLIEAARANGIAADRLAESAERSVASLDACLGPVTGNAEAIDADLRSAMDRAVAAIDSGADETKTTKNYRDLLSNSIRNLDRHRLRWGDWAKLCSEGPGKKSAVHASQVQTAAMRHPSHPRLREDLQSLIRLMFDVAARGLRRYQELKREQGLLDFVDQEVHALDLLSRESVREVLRGEIDLVLVDEFQDTSPLQLAIFLRLADLAKKSVWVGDPKQAIFGFRGTDPALMDAAIESLTSVTRDADLVAAAVDAVTRRSPVETLSTSYRSRPALVDLTNAIFSRAFSLQQAMPVERVRLRSERTECERLGPAVSHWPLSAPSRINKKVLAQAVAAGARDLISAAPTIWDRDTREYRAATAGDLAILCRTNAQCLDVSEELGVLAIPSVVARVGLLDSAEAQVATAGLRLWVDARDRVAAATLIRIIEHPDNAVALIEIALTPDGPDRLVGSPSVQPVLAAREKAEDLDVLAALDAVIDALDLRRLCAAWGSQKQRIANLDALRAHATRYCDERLAGDDAPSLVGFLTYLDGLASEEGWGSQRGDTIARVGSEDAVNVSTWHRAKGLEWPIVILFGLESVREPQAYGVHVLTDRETFDLSDPLGGRWIHFWPNPYSTSNQLGPVKTAYATSDAHRHVARQAERESLRVLYVGWTRARDRLVMAAQQDKLLGGLFGTLARIEPGLIGDPGIVTKGDFGTTWAGHPFELQVVPLQPAPPMVVPPRPGTVRVGRQPAEYPPASLAPSSVPPRPARMGTPVKLGNSVMVRRLVDMEALGTAVHMFFAADDPQRSRQDRLDTASGLLERYRVPGALDPADLVEIGDRLWRWAGESIGERGVVRAEWPLGTKLQNGTLVLGRSDLVLETVEAMLVVDHKLFGLATAESKAEELAGQLGCYADAVALARPGKPISKWVHLPMDGVIVAVE
jgi:ATP-dependent exoDNAse (exonuclease V) beta subunit